MMKTIREAVDVKANDDYTIECEMENGDIYLYDLSEEIEKGTGALVVSLKDISYFKRVSVDEHGSLSWPNGADIDPALIAMEGRLLRRRTDKESA